MNKTKPPKKNEITNKKSSRDENVNPPHFRSSEDFDKNIKAPEKSSRPTSDLEIARQQEYESENRFHDFFTDTNNRISRVAFSVASLLVLFVGWLYRDQLKTTSTENITDGPDLSEAYFMVAISALGLAVFALLLANVSRSRYQRHRFQQKMVEANLNEDLSNTDSPEVVFKSNKDNLKSANWFDRHCNWFSVLGYISFMVGVVAFILFLKPLINAVFQQGA